jgi:hypothetical protein
MSTPHHAPVVPLNPGERGGSDFDYVAPVEVTVALSARKVTSGSTGSTKTSQNVPVSQLGRVSYGYDCCHGCDSIDREAPARFPLHHYLLEGNLQARLLVTRLVLAHHLGSIQGPLRTGYHTGGEIISSDTHIPHLSQA